MNHQLFHKYTVAMSRTVESRRFAPAWDFRVSRAPSWTFFILFEPTRLPWYLSLAFLKNSQMRRRLIGRQIPFAAENISRSAISTNLGATKHNEITTKSFISSQTLLSKGKAAMSNITVFLMGLQNLSSRHVARTLTSTPAVDGSIVTSYNVHHV